jgi:predicted nucleotide-binding protein
MQPITYEVIRRLKKDLIVRNGQGQVILGDTGVKLMQKIHQLSSGTCKFEDGTSKVIDKNKALFIQNHFKGIKIAIFYKFKAEWDALLQVYGAENLTNSVEEFDSTDKCIALQIVSGREGVSLKNAKYLVYYNIDFSATSYWQSRDRLTTMQRQSNEVFWIFSKGGIEMDIYKTVLQKRDYTLKIFKENEK